MTFKATLIIPSETRSREFDPKLLLACFAAERGYRAIVGSRVHMHMRIASLPVGVYLAKDVARISCKIFSVLERLGHRIVAWDEELLLYTDLATYLRKRAADCTVRKLSCFFTWGETDADLVRPATMFAGIPLIPTGNPRGDLMRPEFRRFFDPEVAALRQRYGRYFLVNTNFGRLNHYLPEKRLTPTAPGDLAYRNLEKGDVPLPYWAFRERIMGHFVEMLPRLARAFPDHHIILRPHPGENRQTWRRAAAGCDNVTVVHEGYVAPWLLGADAVIHNGCTTGIEAFLLDRPVVSYMPEVSAEHDLALPRDVSHQIQDFESLKATLVGYAENRRAPVRDSTTLELVARYIANVTGATAGERILDVVDEMLSSAPLSTRAPLGTRLTARRDALARRVAKTIKSFIPGHKNSATYTAHRFPDITIEEISERIARLRAVSGRFDDVQVRRFAGGIFVIEKVD